MGSFALSLSHILVSDRSRDDACMVYRSNKVKATKHQIRYAPRLIMEVAALNEAHMREYTAARRICTYMTISFLASKFEPLH
jgi:hypothetical protein